MANSLSLLDQALHLGEQELQALVAGDVAMAEETSRQRTDLLNMAWEQREPEVLDDFRNKLLRIQFLQGRLTEEARRLHAQLRTQLQQSRKEGRRLDGYKRTVSATAAGSMGRIG